MHQHYPTCSPIYKIDRDLEKNLSFWNDDAGRERGPTGQHSGTQTDYTQVAQFDTLVSALRHFENWAITESLPLLSTPCLPTQDPAGKCTVYNWYFPQAD